MTFSTLMTRSTSAARRAGNGLWAITSYFNPVAYQHRLTNYRIFRERLNVPLIAVELAYGPDFELGQGDADILVRLRGNDVMWQKERLLNVALKTLPDACNKVAWIDCDIVFGRDDWGDRVSRLLDRFRLLQAFERVHHMPQDFGGAEFTQEAAEFTRASAVGAIASGVSLAHSLGEGTPGGFLELSRGHAWAARRDLLDDRGFYDANIIGGGDRAMASAAYGCFEAAARFHRMTAMQHECYLAWARPFEKAVGGAVGLAKCDIFHLWHGDAKDRRSGERHVRLNGFGFDPYVDIEIDENGAWRWASAKPDLHAYVREYFTQRKEDG